MTKSEFLDKWGISYNPLNVGSFEIDRRVELEQDLNEMLSDRSTETYSPEGKLTSVYIPEKSEEEEKDDETEVYVGRWFSVISHT